MQAQVPSVLLLCLFHIFLPKGPQLRVKIFKTETRMVPIAGHLKNDFYEIFALICYQFFQMPFQYLSTELYEIIVKPTAKGMTIWQLETDISGADEMR